MTTFTATFTDGTTITRKTEREYAVAWRATWNVGGKTRTETGFSISREKVSAYKPTISYVGAGISANEKAKAKTKNAKFLVDSGYRVEIAQAVAA